MTDGISKKELLLNLGRKGWNKILSFPGKPGKKNPGKLNLRANINFPQTFEKKKRERLFSLFFLTLTEKLQVPDRTEISSCFQMFGFPSFPDLPPESPPDEPADPPPAPAAAPPSGLSLFFFRRIDDRRLRRRRSILRRGASPSISWKQREKNRWLIICQRFSSLTFDTMFLRKLIMSTRNEAKIQQDRAIRPKNQKICPRSMKNERSILTRKEKMWVTFSFLLMKKIIVLNE